MVKIRDSNAYSSNILYTMPLKKPSRDVDEISISRRYGQKYRYASGVFPYIITWVPWKIPKFGWIAGGWMLWKAGETVALVDGDGGPEGQENLDVH